MAEPAAPDGERLDSWKAIAQYLRRDVATVRRWEKSSGLPVRRVAGLSPRRSVFAYSSEIDAWLTAGRAEPVAAEPAATAASPVGEGRWWAAWTTTLVVVVAGLVLAVRWLSPPFAASDLRVEVSANAVIARDVTGRERWRHTFPVDELVFPGKGPSAPVTIGGDAPFLVALEYSERQGDRAGQSGRLPAFDAEGQVRHAFSFDDEVTQEGRSFSAPWVLTALAAADADGWQIAVSAHHFVWNPGLVTVLDQQLRRRGTFRHDGWIESVQWVTRDRLLAGGFDNPQDGGMVMLLDPARLDRQQPIRTVVMPRSEVNLASGSRFNRAVVQVAPGRITARTIERPADADPADAVYEFTPALALIGAHYSDRYWELHRQLEREGKITHSRDRCPDRAGPPRLLVWEPSTGWVTQTIPRPARPTS